MQACENVCLSETHRVLSGEFFNNLTAAQIDDLFSMQLPTRYASGVSIFSEMEPSRGVFVILDGAVKLSFYSAEGKRLNLHIARRGDILGLSSALSGAPYNLTAETLTPTKLSLIGQSHFMNFLHRHPDAYRAVSKELCRQLTRSSEQLRTVALADSAPRKLARLLLDWVDNEHARRDGGRIRFPLTQEEIGEFIGASRETVSRTLSKLRLQHLVVFEGRSMRIPNLEALASYAQG